MSVGDDYSHSSQGLGGLGSLVPLIKPTFQLVQSALEDRTAPSSPDPFSAGDGVMDHSPTEQSITAEGDLPPKTIPVSKALPRIDHIKTALVYAYAVLQLHDFLTDAAKSLRDRKQEVRFAVDLEGINLGKPPGTADILQLHNGANNKTYIIDLLTLQHSAFNMTFPGLSLTLREVLESPTIPKYFHDVRNDSNALWFHYQISLQGTIDTQIMQNVVYTSRDMSWSMGNEYQHPKKERIVGLRACMEEEKTMLSTEEQGEFNSNKALFHGEDDWKMMRIRPMSERVIKYCTNDVKYLLRLVDQYEAMMEDDKQRRMYTIESERRIAQSQMEEFEPCAATLEERQRRTRAPQWDYWRANDRRHLLLEDQIGRRPVCGPDCKQFWEQTHICNPRTCACHATCLARQQKNAVWYAAQSFEVKTEWCKRISEAHRAGARFHLQEVSLQEGESLPPPTEYLPPPVRLDDEDWAPTEQPPPSSPWGQEETDKYEPEHSRPWQEASEIEDTPEDDTPQDDAVSEGNWQEVVQAQETESRHPRSAPRPASSHAVQSWDPMTMIRSPEAPPE